jgi:hypothetical protein
VRAEEERRRTFRGRRFQTAHEGQRVNGFVMAAAGSCCLGQMRWGNCSGPDDCRLSRLFGDGCWFLVWRQSLACQSWRLCSFDHRPHRSSHHRSCPEKHVDRVGMHLDIVALVGTAAGAVPVALEAFDRAALGDPAEFRRQSRAWEVYALAKRVHGTRPWCQTDSTAAGRRTPPRTRWCRYSVASSLRAACRGPAVTEAALYQRSCLEEVVGREASDSAVVAAGGIHGSQTALNPASCFPVASPKEVACSAPA